MDGEWREGWMDGGYIPDLSASGLHGLHCPLCRLWRVLHWILLLTRVPSSSH